MGERYIDTVEVRSSILLPPTTSEEARSQDLGLFFLLSRTSAGGVIARGRNRSGRSPAAVQIGLKDAFVVAPLVVRAQLVAQHVVLAREQRVHAGQTQPPAEVEPGDRLAVDVVRPVAKISLA